MPEPTADSLRHFIQQNLQPQERVLLNNDAQAVLLYIDITQQRLYLFERDELSQTFPVSTSRHGLGQQSGSFQTPRGIHRIADKIGQGEPLGRVFKGRQPLEQICTINQADEEEDVISSRILWLDGLQPGLNRGGDCDSYQRYIYIHGTQDEAHIGQPASIGCIRMNNADVIELFDRVSVNDAVLIECLAK